LIKPISVRIAIDKNRLEKMNGIETTHVGLDKIVIGIPYPKFPKADELNPPSQEEVALLQAKRKEFVASMKHIESMITAGKFCCGKIKSKDSKRYKVLSEVDGALLCVFSLGFSYGSGVINFEVNPHRLNSDKIAELLGLLSVMFDGHYDELYEQGVVSHAEFYVDVFGVDLSDLALLDTGRRATTMFKGTTYHGRRTSSLVGTMYDKAKERGEDGKRVRIEARIKRRDIPFQDLVEGNLPNPLSSFLAVEKSKLQLIAQEWKHPQLADQIIELGMYGAVANKPARDAILTRLKEEAAPWWQPDIFWAAHREKLLQFKPGHAGGFM
jgi:hypothetical protein